MWHLSYLPSSWSTVAPSRQCTWTASKWKFIHKDHIGTKADKITCFAVSTTLTCFSFFEKRKIGPTVKEFSCRKNPFLMGEMWKPKHCLCNISCTSVHCDWYSWENLFHMDQICLSPNHLVTFLTLKATLVFITSQRVIIFF